MAPQRFEVPRTAEGLRAAQPRLGACLEALHAPPRLAYRAELVAEEILTNLVKYGVPRHAPDVVTLSLWLEEAGRVLCMVIEDATVPFSPVWEAEPARGRDIATVQPGGLGLSLVRQSSDRLDYESLARVNRLVARFARPPA